MEKGRDFRGGGHREMEREGERERLGVLCESICRCTYAIVRDMSIAD